MIPYIIIFILISLNAFLNSKRTKHLNFVIYIFLILFYALRRNIGTDWLTYADYFYNINSQFLVERYKFEIGYKILNYLGKPILKSYWNLVILVSIFNGILFWKATNRYTKNIGLIILLSLYYLFYPTLEAFRQSITLFIFYYSLQYIENKEKRYLILNLLGLLFHRTGIFSLLFYIFYKYKKSIKWIVLVLVSFVILDPIFTKILSFFPVYLIKYNWYFKDNSIKNPLFSFKTIEYFILLCSYFILEKKCKIGEAERLPFYLILLGFVLQITLGRVSSIIYRMIYYTDIGLIYGYTIIFNKFKQPLFRYSYLAGMIVFIFIRFYRIFPYTDPRFYYNIVRF